MDPLSITASIITIVGVGGQAAKAVRKLASLKGAPDLVLALNNEISDLHLVVLAIQGVFQRQQTSALSFPGNQVVDSNVDASVTNSLRHAKEKVVELEALHNRLTKTTTASGSSGSTAFNKGAWLREQKRVKKMQEDLRNVRLKLAAALSVLNSSTLLRIQEGVQVTQNSTTDLQTLQQQCETDQRQRAIGQENSIQVIQDKIIEMQTLQQQMETAQTQRAVGQESSVQVIQDEVRDLQRIQQQISSTQNQRLGEHEAAMQQPITQLLNSQQRLELKLDIVEARLVAKNTEFRVRGPTQSILNPRCSLDRISTSSTVRITTSLTRWRCADSCTCSCHRHQRPNKRTPNILDRFIGVLFVGYHGLPKISERCSDGDCIQQSSSTLLISYFFPTWLLARAMILVLRLSSVHGPELNLRIPRIVSDTSRIFHYAIDGSIEDLKEIFHQGLGSPMDLNASNGNTALFFAVEHGRIEVCQLLLHAGTDPFLENYQSITAIDQAWTQLLSNEGDASTHESLRALFPREIFLEKSNFSLLHRIVLGLNPISLDTIIDSLSRSVINESDAHGRTALWWAARRADALKVSLLLKHGADANTKNITGNTPLMTAMKTKNQTCIRLLLDAGSDIHQRNPLGWLPLHMCCYYGSDIDIVEAFLRGGGDIDDRVSSTHSTPLLLAAQENHIHIVKYLISRGANLNATDHDGECSLHLALSYNRPQVLRFLLQHKASHCLKSKADESLLHYAAQFGNVECLEVLNAFRLDGIDPEDRITGASPNQRFKVKGLTALEIAEQRKDVTPEWRAMFRKLVHGIRFPESKSPELSTAEETEEFEDALENQD